jgi:hypothetical protein
MSAHPFSLKRVNSWPLPRGIFTEMVTNPGEQNPRSW